MPLEHGKSKAALSHNIATERHAGKPEAQAIAIAFSEKRKAEHKNNGEHMEKPKIQENSHFDTVRHFKTDAESVNGMTSADEFIRRVHAKNNMACSLIDEAQLKHVLVLDKKKK